MTLGTFLLIAAAVHGLLGIGLLLAPAALMQPLDVALSPGGAMLARLLGCALIALALIIGWVRRHPSGQAARTVVIVGAAYEALSALTLLIGAIGGATGPLGWIPVGIHIALATGFLYFLPDAGEA